jgi:uncharacterized iron-regulated membrane protein
MSNAASRSSLYGTLWRWHFLAASIVIPFVLWQSVTGSLYLWSEWWTDWRHPELRFVTASGQHRPPSEQITAALHNTARLPDEIVSSSAHSHGAMPHADHAPTVGDPHRSRAMAVQEVLLADDPGRSTVVLMAGANELPRALFVNPYDATVLGTLAGSDWLPGVTRALHGGWPLGKPGSWLLELGDGWAIFMIISGLYLWWPRERSLRACLRPRFGRGARTALRDLHAIVAVLFAAVFLFFLVSALPWTAFWGQQLLPRVQMIFGQTSPADFSPGGADARQFGMKLPLVDELVTEVRRRNMRGTLDIKLAPWPDAPLNIANRNNSPSDDRVIVADSRTGQLIGDYANDDLPTIPRLVALGVHLHQGDFGPVNVWINTAFACSLIWLSATGLASWWVRRPKGRMGVPPKRLVAWRWRTKLAAFVFCLVLPIFGLSVVAVAGMDRLLRRTPRSPVVST